MVRPRRRTPVISDVAERAGVSAMTVSRVLNGFPGVADGTRTRVEQAVAELGYRANSAARTLASGRSRVLGVVGVETPHYGPSGTLFAIEAAARAAGHSVHFVTMRHADAGEMRASLDELRDSHIDGVIVLAPVRAAIEAVAGLEADVPHVIASADPTAGLATVGIDQEEGARLATRHLLDLGHETVHHVRGPKSWIDANARAAGWRKELRAQGRHAGTTLTGDWSPSSGYEAGRRLAADPGVTAVFVANDQMALGLLRCLNEQGRSVPADVSVIGFDDIPEAEFFSPPLTTVRQDFAEMGRRGVALLLEEIGAPQRSGTRVTVPATLVERSSTAPPM